MLIIFLNHDKNNTQMWEYKGRCKICSRRGEIKDLTKLDNKYSSYTWRPATWNT